jgi:hypothetical protein
LGKRDTAIQANPAAAEVREGNVQDENIEEKRAASHDIEVEKGIPESKSE